MNETSKSAGIRRILTGVSLVLFAISLIAAGGLFFSLTEGLPIENAYIDGADFALLLSVLAYAGSMILSIAVTIGINLIGVVIWSVYGLIELVQYIIRKRKEKKKLVLQTNSEIFESEV